MGGGREFFPEKKKKTLTACLSRLVRGYANINIYRAAREVRDRRLRRARYTPEITARTRYEYRYDVSRMISE